MPEDITYRRVPRVAYAYTLAGLFLATFIGFLLVLVWRSSLPQMQHYYLWTYCRYALYTQLPTLPHHINRYAAGYEYLRRNVFDGHSVTELIQTPLISVGVCLAVGLLLGMALDAKRLNAFRKGKKLRGWDVITPRKFNRRTKGDGFALQIER